MSNVRLMCDCGAIEEEEIEGTGRYQDGGETKYICLSCWIKHVFPTATEQS